ncbi:MAG TPA: heme exporter protein CcmD [Rhizomicrobium sp.]|jgi:heme exporter protein CcmD|nr:heme exporter protein CcmD [Rhizomicrobium sp.]
MNHFFEMGGYACYVWPAYGATAIGLGGAILLVRRAYLRAIARLAQLERAS